MRLRIVISELNMLILSLLTLLTWAVLTDLIELTLEVLRSIN